MGCGSSSEKAPEVEEKKDEPIVEKVKEVKPPKEGAVAPNTNHAVNSVTFGPQDCTKKYELKDPPITVETEKKEKEIDNTEIERVSVCAQEKEASFTQIPPTDLVDNTVPEDVKEVKSDSLKSSWLTVELDEENFSLFSEDMLEKLNEFEIECATVSHLLIADSQSEFLCQTIGVAVLLNEKMEVFNEVLKKSGARLSGYGATPIFYERWKDVFFTIFPRYINGDKNSFPKNLLVEWKDLWKRMLKALYKGGTSAEGQVLCSLYNEINAQKLAVDVDLIRSREKSCDPSRQFEARMLDRAQRLFSDLSDEALISPFSIHFLVETFHSMVLLLPFKTQLNIFFQKIKSSEGEKIPSQSYLVALFQPFVDTSREFLPDIWNPAVEYRFGTYYHQMVTLLSNNGETVESGKQNLFPFFGDQNSNGVLKKIEGFSFLDRKRTTSIEVCKPCEEEMDGTKSSLSIFPSDLPARDELIDAEKDEDKGLRFCSLLKKESLFRVKERAPWAVIDLSCRSLLRKPPNKVAETRWGDRGNSPPIPKDCAEQACEEVENKCNASVCTSEKVLPNTLCTSTKILEEREVDTSLSPEPEKRTESHLFDDHSSSANDDCVFSSSSCTKPNVHEDSQKSCSRSSFSSSMVVFVGESVVGNEEGSSGARTSCPFPLIAEPKMDYECVLCTNIEDSVSMWKSNSELMYRVQKNYNRLVRSVISRFGAREIENEGDSFIIVCENVVNGLKVALGIQLELMRAVSLTSEFKGSSLQHYFQREKCRGADDEEKSCWNNVSPRVRISLELCTERKGNTIAIPEVGNASIQRYQFCGSSLCRCAMMESLACGGQIIMSLEAVKELFMSPDFLFVSCDGFLRSVDLSPPVPTDEGKSLKDYVAFVDLGLCQLPGNKEPPLHLFSAVPKCLESRKFANYPAFQ